MFPNFFFAIDQLTNDHLLHYYNITRVVITVVFRANVNNADPWSTLLPNFSSAKISFN